ncbi:hypothetical protein BT96DRAFT_919112, partial [Gymnopus androsaceus JB14]
MLFSGVTEPALWSSAAARVSDSLRQWVDVVGSGPGDVLADENLFRVLEWRY